MKQINFSVFGVILILLCLAACGSDEPQRADELAFKGMELYSWQSDSGEWQYALMPGTNRIKTVEEVLAEPLDQPALEAAIAKLAVGETVFWTSRVERAGDTQLDFPPQQVIDAIVQRASEVGVQVEVVHP